MIKKNLVCKCQLRCSLSTLNHMTSSGKPTSQLLNEAHLVSFFAGATQDKNACCLQSVLSHFFFPVFPLVSRWTSQSRCTDEAKSSQLVMHGHKILLEAESWSTGLCRNVGKKKGQRNSTAQPLDACMYPSMREEQWLNARQQHEVMFLYVMS